MEVETGPAVSIISEERGLSLFPTSSLSRPSVNLRTYTTEPIPVVGQVKVRVQYGKYTGTHLLYVVKGPGPALLGRDWLNHIQLDWSSIKVLATSTATPTLDQLT